MSRSSCMSKVRGCKEKSSQYGAAMIEFALILPILIVLVFGVTELGRALYQQNTLDKAVLTGARFLARYPGAVASDCSEGVGWSVALPFAQNLVATGQEVAGGEALLPGLDATKVKVEKPKGDDFTEGCVVIVTVSVPFASLFGDSVVPLLNLGAFNLNAKSEERYHGE